MVRLRLRPRLRLRLWLRLGLRLWLKLGLWFMAVASATLAKQVDESMGPTVWLPSTHAQHAHAAFNAPPEVGGPKQGPQQEEGVRFSAPKEALLSSVPRRLGVMRRGDAVVFDSRILHCGSANESEARRAMFYFSFSVPNISHNGTLDAELQRRELRLSSSDEWLCEGGTT